MLHPGWIFLISVVLLGLALHFRLALPIALVAVAAVAAVLAGFFNPARHLVEGGFGYLNLILALFAGGFFGQAMRGAGLTDDLAAWLARATAGNRWAIALAAAALLFLVGMFVGIAGVAVLAAGVFAVPMLRSIGMGEARIAAFIAVVATCGMIAPPVNVPAMTIADGVNMPFADFAGPLLVLSLPTALFAVWYFLRSVPAGAPLPAIPPPSCRLPSCSAFGRCFASSRP